ncbi:M15 family metallopeptidase [Prochlorococcus sp. MIT 1341]|uniref:M15 family metallopeptidase n=1 Tax=Prochlorococcus sp. MIT 1341 TaxID=3096221 RepID=UPI002A75F0CA|nr:M15 family metallopeptidase [Prochlorococcus sp. MIT 1341]
MLFLLIGASSFSALLIFGSRKVWLGDDSLELPPSISEISQDRRLLGHFPYPEADQNMLVVVHPGIRVHLDTARALKKMTAAAVSDGISLSFLSGYRSHNLQKEIFFEVKSERNQTAIQRAKVSAPPGYSEHSTGYAIDLGDSTRPETHFRKEFENTPAFKWLEKNAPRYHFTLSFPEGNPQGVSYEPWHWRYEGSADALREFENARTRSSSIKN